MQPLVVPDQPPPCDAWLLAEWRRAAARDPAAVNALELPVTSGDYVGGLIDRANREHLIEQFGEECFVRLRWDFGAEGLALRLTADPEAVRGVLDALAAAESFYPILDEQIYDRLLQELVDEALGDWALADALRELRDDGFADDVLGAVGQDELADALRAAVESGAHDPYAEGGGDCHVVLPMGAMLEQLRRGLPQPSAEPLAADRPPVR